MTLVLYTDGPTDVQIQTTTAQFWIHINCLHDDFVTLFLYGIHCYLFVLQNQLKETQRRFQQRIQQRENDLQQLREAVKSHKVSLEKKRSLSQSQFRLSSFSPTEAHCVIVMCV